ncbi:CoA-binding protein [Actibacterium sp. D379-3]
MSIPSDDLLKDVLTGTRVVAVVGASQNPGRPSHTVARFLQHKGMRVIPVNPGLAGKMLFGEQVYSDLAAIPADIPVDMVDIFRRSEYVPDIVEQALAHLSALRTIWMQLGVEDAQAAARAEATGITVIMNRCPKIDYARLFGT